MKEQNENIKTFCNLLGEAQEVMQELSKKFKDTPSAQIEDCKLMCLDHLKKSMCLGSTDQLSSDGQLSQNEQEVKALPDQNDYIYRSEEYIQINREEDGIDEEKAISNVSADGDVDDKANKDSVCRINVIDQESEVFGNSIKNDISQTSANAALATISEASEKSTSASEKESANDATVKNQAETKPFKPICTILSDNTCTNSECKKKVKSLKDRATEVVVNSIITKITITGNKQVVPVHRDKVDNTANTQENKKQQIESNKDIKNDEVKITTIDDNMKTDSRTSDFSSKSKLSIQLMPPIDIRRGLVTQKIPTIIITATESTPQVNVPQDSNIAYEIVKHLSGESVNVQTKSSENIRESGVQTDKKIITVKEITEKCKEICTAIKPQTHDSGVQTNKSKSNSSLKISTDANKLPNNDMESISSDINKDVSLVKDETSATELCQNEDCNAICRQEAVNALNSEQSSIVTYDYVFNKKVSQKPIEELKTAVEATVEATVSFDVPVTTFINTCFKSESESDFFLETESLDEDNRSAKKSTIVEYLGKKECVKEFINEMIKDPHTEIIFKSYQVLQDQSAHHSDPEVEDTNLSLIDKDVYQTFVNSEGLKNVPNTHSSATVSYNGSRNVANKNLASPAVRQMPSEVYSTFINPAGLKTVKNKQSRSILNSIGSKNVTDNNLVPPPPVIGQMPPEFYSTKATQCDEIIENKVDDTSSQGTNILWNVDSVSENSSFVKSYDSQTFKSFNKPEPHSNLVSESGHNNKDYVSRSSKNLSQSTSPRLVTPQRRSTIPEDIRKRISTARSSNNRKISQQRGSDFMQGIEHRSSKYSHVNNSQLKISRSLPSQTFSDNSDSIKSDNTADVIFEINRGMLRSKTQNSKVELGDVGGASDLKKPSFTVSKKDSATSHKTADLEHRSSANSAVSEYVITHDISLQTSLNSLSDEEVLNLHQFSKHSANGTIPSLQKIVTQDTQSKENVNTTSCCVKLLCKNKTPQDMYVKYDETQNTLRKTTLSSYESEQKSVQIKEPEDAQLAPLFQPKPIKLTLPDKLRRRLSRKAATPVGSFIQGLTSHTKDDIVIARNLPPQNEFSVFEEYSASDILNAIKHATENWKELEKEKAEAAETASQSQNVHDILIPEDFEYFPKHDDKTETESNKIEIGNNNESEANTENSDPKIKAYTIMAVNVEPPNCQFSVQSKGVAKPTNGSPLQRNIPGGDDAIYGKDLEIGGNVQVCSPYTKHEGIFPRCHKHRQKTIKKVSEISSSSEATTLETISEKTDEYLSEGEVQCKCSASIGEIHVCSCMKNLKPIQYLKRNPQNLMQKEFGKPNVKIEWQKEFNSNWVAYYVSRSPSPEVDDTESFDKSTDSSGMVRK